MEDSMDKDENIICEKSIESADHLRIEMGKRMLEINSLPEDKFDDI